MQPVTTVVLTRDGRHHLTSKNMAQADAERWAEEGFHVFQIVARGPYYALRHVNSGEVFSTRRPGTGEADVVQAEFLLPPPKGG